VSIHGNFTSDLKLIYWVIICTAWCDIRYGSVSSCQSARLSQVRSFIKTGAVPNRVKLLFVQIRITEAIIPPYKNKIQIVTFVPSCHLRERYILVQVHCHQASNISVPNISYHAPKHFCNVDLDYLKQQSIHIHNL